MKKRLLAISIAVALVVTGGCGEDKPPQQPANVTPNDARPASAGGEESAPANGQLVASHGGVTLTIKPQNPTIGSCVEASYKGRPSNKVFTWQINDSVVQQDESGRYCIERARRADVVKVMVGDSKAGGVDSTVIVNSPPRITDTRIEMVVDGPESFIEVNPVVEDADEDYVSLKYQWLINGELRGEHAENRLGSGAYQQGDSVQVRITPDDGFDKGRPYESRNVNVPNSLPTITSEPPKTFEALEYAYRVEANDPDGGQLTYSLETAPEGMTVDAETGAIVWPLETVPSGEYQVKVVVTDPDGNTGYQAFNLSIRKREVQKPN